MPGRGRKVADAWIDIHGDLDSFERALKKQAAKGRKSGREYGKNFTDAHNDYIAKRLGLEEKDAHRVAKRMKKSLFRAMMTGDSDDWSKAIASFGSFEEFEKNNKSFIDNLRRNNQLTSEQARDFKTNVDNYIKQYRRLASGAELPRRGEGDGWNVDDLTDSVNKLQAATNDYYDTHANRSAELSRLSGDWTEDQKRQFDKIRAVKRKHHREELAEWDKLMSAADKEAANRIKNDAKAYEAWWGRELDKRDADERFQRDRERLRKSTDDTINRYSWRSFKRLLRDQEASLKEHIRRQTVRRKGEVNDWDKMWAAAEKEVETRRKATLGGMLDENQMRRDRDLWQNFVHGMAGDWERAFRGQSNRTYKEWRADIDRLIVKQRELGNVTDDQMVLIRRSMDKTRIEWEKSARRMSSDYDRIFIGRLKGSRSELLNVIGRAFGPLENSIARGLKPASDAISEFVADIAEKFGFDINRTALASGFAKLVPTIAGAVLGVGALIYVTQMAVSAISGLAAMVVGIFSTAAFAVGGFVAALGPMIAGLGVGIGAVVFGLMGASDELKESLQPFKDWFEELKQLTSEALLTDIAEDLGVFVDILREFATPMFVQAAEELRGAFEGFTKAIDTPNFRNVMGVLRDVLPQIAGDLARGLGALATGLSAVFSAIAPAVRDVTDSIATGLETWAAWAASADGQNSIADWFDRAWESAQVVWEVIKGLGRVLGGIFGIGKDYGDNWMQGWADGLNRFADSLADGEDGRERLTGWFDRAVELGSHLGEFIDGLAEMFSGMDTEQASRNLGDLIESLGSIAGFIDNISRGISDLEHFIEILTEPQEFDKWFDSTPFGAEIQKMEDDVLDFLENFKSPIAFGEWVASTEFGKTMNAMEDRVGKFFTDDLPKAMEDAGEAWDQFWADTGTWWSDGWENNIAAPAREGWDSFVREWDEFWNDTIGGNLSDFWAKIVKGWGDFWAPVSEQIGDATARWDEEIFQPLRDLFTDVGEEIGRRWDEFWNDTVGGGVSEFGAEMRADWEEHVAGPLRDAWDVFTENWDNFWNDTIGGNISDAWASLKSKWSEAWDKNVEGTANEKWTKFTEKWDGFWNGLGEKVSDSFASWKTGITEGWNDTFGPGSQFQAGLDSFVEGWDTFWNDTVGGTISDAWATLKEEASEWGTMVIEGFKQGVADTWTSFTDWMANTVDDFVAMVRGWFGIASPSTVFAEIGGFIVDGLWGGLSEGWDTFVTNVGGLVDRFIGVVKGGWDTLFGDTNLSWDNIKNTVTGKTSKTREDAERDWAGMVSDSDTSFKEIAKKAYQGMRDAEDRVSEKGAEIKATLKGSFDGAASSVDPAFATMKSKTSTGALGVVRIMAALPVQISNAMNVGRVLYVAGANLITGFINGIYSRFYAVRSVLTTLTALLPSWKGPASTDATILTPAGQLVIGGFIKGLESQFPTVQGSMRDLTKKLADPFSPSEMFKTGRDATSALAEGLLRDKALVDSAFDGIVAHNFPNVGLDVAGSRGRTDAGAATAGRSVVVAEGAIQVQSNAQDGTIVAEQVMDQLAATLA